MPGKEWHAVWMNSRIPGLLISWPGQGSLGILRTAKAVTDPFYIGLSIKAAKDDH